MLPEDVDEAPQDLVGQAAGRYHDPLALVAGDGGFRREHVGRVRRQSRGQRPPGRRGSQDPAGEPAVLPDEQVSNWLNTNGSYPSQSAAYDNWGNQVSVADETNRTVTFTYDSTYHEFLTSTSNAAGETEALQWDALCGTRSPKPCFRQHPSQHQPKQSPVQPVGVVGTAVAQKERWLVMRRERLQREYLAAIIDSLQRRAERNHVSSVQ